MIMLVTAWILLIVFLLPTIGSWLVAFSPKQEMNFQAWTLFIVLTVIEAVSAGIIFG